MRPTLTTAEAASTLGITEHHVRRLCRAGVLPHFRIGEFYRFDPDELDQFLRDAHQDGAGLKASA